VRYSRTMLGLLARSTAGCCAEHEGALDFASKELMERLSEKCSAKCTAAAQPVIPWPWNLPAPLKGGSQWQRRPKVEEREHVEEREDEEEAEEGEDEEEGDDDESSSCSSSSEEEETVPDGLTPEELEPWLQAAREFHMSTDFDISDDLPDLKSGERLLRLSELMDTMKAESKGKRTIQVLGDKILLGKLLSNLGVPQMPVLYATYNEAKVADLQDFVDTLANGRPEAFDLVVKPTHLSNGTGALFLSADTWRSRGYGAQKLASHMDTYLVQRAADTESEALRSLLPGFLIQPRYRSCISFGAPLEMRVVTLWGKARVGVWWWGRPNAASGSVAGGASTGSAPQRTTWLLRQAVRPGCFSEDDGWEIIHQHKGHNPGFDAAVELFRRAMPAMAIAAEAIATAVGAPFLRSDFFVGSGRWGVRLNEVAYGSGIDYRRKGSGAELVDDGPAIARILQEGHALCKQRYKPEYFLAPLGADGTSYVAGPPEWWEWWKSEDDDNSDPAEPSIEIADWPEARRHKLANWVLRDFSPAAIADVKPMVVTGCQTPRRRGHHSVQRLFSNGGLATQHTGVFTLVPVLPVSSAVTVTAVSATAALPARGPPFAPPAAAGCVSGQHARTPLRHTRVGSKGGCCSSAATSATTHMAAVSATSVAVASVPPSVTAFAASAPVA